MPFRDVPTVNEVGCSSLARRASDFSPYGLQTALRGDSRVCCDTKHDRGRLTRCVAASTDDPRGPVRPSLPVFPKRDKNAFLLPMENMEKRS